MINLVIAIRRWTALPASGYAGAYRAVAGALLFLPFHFQPIYTASQFSRTDRECYMLSVAIFFSVRCIARFATTKQYIANMSRHLNITINNIYWYIVFSVAMAQKKSNK